MHGERPKAGLVRFWFVLCFGLPQQVLADSPGSAITEGHAQPDEIVVVAHKYPRALRDVAANVTVLLHDDSRMELAGNVADALRYVPGIDYESSGVRFGAESINIRGISGNRVAIRVDGVPLSDQFDTGSFSNATRDFVDAGFVRQIEVLHGPASALYGSAAIGGVVAMRTVAPIDVGLQQGKGGHLSSSFDDADGGLHVTALQSLGTPRLSVVAGMAVQRGQQADAAAVGSNLDHRELAGRSGLIKIVFEDTFGNTWRAAAYRQITEVDSTLQSMLGSGRFRTTTALEGDDHYRGGTVSLEYDAEEFWGVDHASIRVYSQASDIDQWTYDERALASRPVAIDRYFSFEQTSRGFEAGFRELITSGRIEHELGFGLDYRRRLTREYRDGMEAGLDDGETSSTLLGEVFPLRDFPISKTQDWGAYLEETMRAGRWSLIAALRADRYDMRPRVDAMYAEDYPFADPVSLSVSEVSPKFGLIARISGATEAYLQYAHGFRAPPYEDANISLDIPLFNIRAVPNPELRAERSDGIELGIRWRGPNGQARLSLFRTEYEDFIESRVRIGTDPASGRILFQSQNIDRAVIEGVEAGASYGLRTRTTGLSLEASVFIARGTDRQSGAPLNSVGPPQAVVGMDWASANERWRARLLGTLTAAWDDRDETTGELFEPPGHAVYDAYLAYQPGPRVTLRAGLRNLTDQTTWSWTHVRGLAPGDPTVPYLSRPGRSFTVGIEMNW